MSHFETFKLLLETCEAESCSISEAALQSESLDSGQSTESILVRVAGLVQQMEDTIESGRSSNEKSMSGLSGTDATKLMSFIGAESNVCSPFITRLMAYGLATLEENARMKTIVACPTAGGSGTVPAVLIAMEHEHGIEREKTVRGLLTAGCIGEIVSRKMPLSGAAAGCQAEVGVAGGMAAAALVELQGGSPSQVLSAAAIAMQNLMGLVCDPVGGLVEVPCVVRNGLSGVQAVSSATMALAGVHSFIPVDEVVDAMVHVGQLMPRQLKETAEGGLATTKTASGFSETFFGSSE